MLPESTRSYRFAFFLIWLGLSPLVLAEEAGFKAVVAEPFLPLRSGPGSGYPVVHTLEQGETFHVHKRRTEWVQVTDANGRSGWAAFAQVQLARSPEGAPLAFEESAFDQYQTRALEFGYLPGLLDGDPTHNLFAGLWWTPNWSAEFNLGQTPGQQLERSNLYAAVSYSPRPQWRLSPYVSGGLGLLWTDPEVGEDDESAHINGGLGLRWWVGERFHLRTEYRGYLLEDENIHEWKLGLGVGF